MYSKNMEALISAALADGVLTEKEKQVLFKRAETEGIDLDEFEMVLDARLVELQNAEMEKAEKSAPKSTKYGDVRKCPACGAHVPALAVSCAECGHEFTGVDASSSVQNLSKAISGCKSLLVKEQLIKNFPVPNAKHDLFDLIVFLMHHIKDEVYMHKLQECIDRAKYLFPSDPLLAKVIEDATKVIEYAPKAEKIKKIEKYEAGIGLAIWTISVWGSMVVYSLLDYALDWGWWGSWNRKELFVTIGTAVGVVLVALAKLLFVRYKKMTIPRKG